MENPSEQLFREYFAGWIEAYKRGAVRPVTFQKYQMTLRRLTELAPALKISELDKRRYQTLLNRYAETHEKQTTMDFHHHLKSSILDAVDEGALKTDPTRKAVVKGKPAAGKRPKFLGESELRRLLANLDLAGGANWDWLILLCAKTGLRFAEALGLTPGDFDFAGKTLTVSKTWDYKTGGGFADTKNESSKRTIAIDGQLSGQLKRLLRDLPPGAPVFARGKTFNSTPNSRLKTLCAKSGVPAISLHGLRHTHASMLIFHGVSIASIAKRLGHSNTLTTQNTYLHLIRELEDRDNKKIAQIMAELH
jgi:integrase